MEINPDEVAVVKIAITKLADEKVGAMYRHMLSDDILDAVAHAAVAASVRFRNAKEI